MPPGQIAFRGAIYKIAFRSGDQAHVQVYEYTSNGENVETWTTLLSVIFSRGERVSFDVLAKNFAYVALARQPKPRLKIYDAGDALAIRVIYDFRALPDGYFESNVRKQRYSESCGGLFDISIAYKVGREVSADVQITENEMLATDFLSLPFATECGAD